MMNNFINSGAHEICSNHNNTNPPVVSFVGLDCNNQKQFTNWETNNDHTTTNNANPSFINNSTTKIFDTFHSSSSSSTFASNNFISSNYSQFPNYPSSNFFKHGVDENEDKSYYNTSSSSSIHDRRIGLNLGYRTYFSSMESTSSMTDRLIRRARGGGFYLENHHQVPRCQAEGCMVDLTNAKHYHRRHKVCEFHSKASMVVVLGIEQRFCQQCSRFHVLAEFDETKRSCRKRLADHNRRRRKLNRQPTGPSDPPPHVKPSENAKLNKMGSSSSSASRSELGVQESSSAPTKCDPADQLHHPPPSALSLGGDDDQIDKTQHIHSTTHHHDQSRPFIAMTTAHDAPTSTSLFIQRSSDQNLFYSNANSHEYGGSDRNNQHHHNHQEEDLHNLQQLRQAMFDVEFV